ncbi:phosphoribosyltransferase [Belnapia rosea]|uniref:phosphoribosyltransferase n=1 Tax=Belnapia rosea TaxID=938405 RepID=UPI00088FA121|nr:phosphoribosyltransferase [Belnapia rosea]SDB73297.1 Adenine/guanine phosphoribosyltransferase [Belnapia rosea]
MAFWQEFEAPIGMETPRRADALVPMPDGSALRLPLRDYGAVGVTGLIANQASLAVARRLAGWMADAASRFAPEVVVGLPTLGHVFGPLVAEALGHSNWVAPGYSRKLWYEEGLSVPLASSTTPVPRRLWLDPRLVARIEGRRVLLVDDVISTGHSALAGLELLAKAGVRPAAACVAMAQGDRWRAAWPGEVPLVAAFATPLYRPTPEGWVPMPETAPRDVAL